MAVEQLNRVNPEAHSPQKIVENRAWVESLVPWRREPAPTELHQSNGGEVTLYENGKPSRTREVVGKSAKVVGVVAAGVGVLTLNLEPFVGGVVTYYAGKWVDPNK